MTEARNPDFPYDGEEDSLVRAVSTNVNMDLASREPSPALAGLAGNDHGGAPSPAQSSKPGSDTAETASIPAPTVEDATDSSSEAGNHNSDNGSSTHAGPSTHTPAYQEALENLRSVAAAIESGVYLGPAKMRIQAEKNGDRDFTLRVHWDDEETGEAVATPANSRPAVTHAAPADLGRPRDDLGDAPAQPVELPHNNLEPVQETETEANEEEEVNPHALPEIHHQQQRSAASAAPAAGSQTRAIEPGSLLNDADNSGHRSSGSLPSIYTPGGRVFYFPPYVPISF
ncbi:hypothetical protein BJ166DRAFT_380068 [Pestalotiopsis sp. NC0098]|nr:hypothetical protein BJ166DRAFT_380068 [Pestalotiopsis sp. NC0098]